MESQRGKLSLLIGPMYAGKCLGKGTECIKYSLDRVRVEDIRPGDKLLGPDSKPRTVGSISRGRGMMYNITPNDSDVYQVNGDHIIPMLISGKKVDMSVKEILQESPQFQKSLIGYRSDVTHNIQSIVHIDPYDLGVSFGNGYFKTGELDSLIETTSPYFEVSDLKIPTWITHNTTKVRVNFLAGLVDGACWSPKEQILMAKRHVTKEMLDDVAYVFRSLGFGVILDNESIEIVEVPIDVPTRRVAMKKNTSSIPSYSFSITEAGIGDYYGFTLEEDPYFMLKDCTVSHNTTELLRRLFNETVVSSRVLYVNHSSDTRTEGPYSSHNPLYKQKLEKESGVTFISASKASEIPFEDYEIIGIDEGQFFPDLLETVISIIDKHPKRVIVAGLTGSYTRKPIGDIIYLIPHADDVKVLSSLCYSCSLRGMRTKAPFTKKISGDDSELEIGGADKYIAVCRNCF